VFGQMASQLVLLQTSSNSTFCHNEIAVFG
jgi:hypothetical protein